MFGGAASSGNASTTSGRGAPEVQCCKMVDGVMRLYRDKQAMADDRPMPWPCPPRDEFIRHRKIILDMVYNGPL